MSPKLVARSDDCFISFTMNTAHFCKACISLTRDLMALHTQDMDQIITAALVDVFKAQVKHFEVTIRSPDFVQKHTFILKNSQYVLEVLMGKIESLCKKSGHIFPVQLEAINGEYRRLKSLVKKSSNK